MRLNFLPFLLLSITLFAGEKEPFVEIYKTRDSGLYGRSIERDIVLSVKDSVFKRHETLKAKDYYNFQTAVTLNKEVVDELDRRMGNRDSIQIGFVKISREGAIYTIEDDNLFLSLSFSIERANDEIIDMISRHYWNNIPIRDLVVDYYKAHYVIKIHSAENLLFSEAQEITYDEVIIMATIIGDKDQWLWGIHDGRDYLRELLFD